MFAIDTETCLIVPGRQFPALVCLSTSAGDLFSWRDAYEPARAALAGSLVGHNIAFDLGVLVTAFPDLLPLVFQAYDEDRVTDTGVRQKLIDNARGLLRVAGRNYKLDSLTQRYLNLALDKGADGWRLRYVELRDTPIAHWPLAAKEYAKTDAISTALLAYVQEDHGAYLVDQFRQSRADFWLKLMSAWGLTTDPRAVSAYRASKEKELAHLGHLLREAGLLRPDRLYKAGKKKGQTKPGSRDTKAAQERMRATGSVALTKGGKKLALDKGACKESGDDLLVAYADFSSVGKTLSTDIPLLERGLIHAHYEVLLENGRTSSSPNVQNLPRKVGVRECYVPRPGFVFASADYDGFELRTWSQVCIKAFGRSSMAEVLNRGDDPHTMVGATVLGCTYADAMARVAAGDEDANTARQVGKVANFGLPGGLGVETFVEYAKKNYGVSITLETSRRVKADWKRTWWEADRYLRWVGTLGDSVDQLYSGRVRGGMKYTDLANTLFSGLAADAAKNAGWLLAKACYLDTSSVLYGSRPVNFIHDEFIVESPVEIGHECAHEVARLMMLGAAPFLPDVPPKAKPLLMDRWSKKAKQTWDKNRLVAWNGSSLPQAT